MSAFLERIPFSPEKTDFSTLRFTQSPTSHVHSPFFTYDTTAELEDGKMTYRFGHGLYPRIIGAAKAAFASVLNVQLDSIVVTVLNNPSEPLEYRFRLSTSHPWKLPQKPKPVPIDNSDVIDVEIVPQERRLK